MRRLPAAPRSGRQPDRRRLRARGAAARAWRASPGRPGRARGDASSSTCVGRSSSRRNVRRRDLAHLLTGRAAHGRVGGDEADTLAVRGARPRGARAACRRAARSGPRAARPRAPRRRRRRRRPRARRSWRRSSASSSVELAHVGVPARVEQVVAVEEVERRLGHSSHRTSAALVRRRRACAPRCRRASYSSTAAATLTFSDSTPGASGIEIAASHVLRTSGRTPLPSAPKTSATPPVRSACHIVCGASAVAAYDQRSSRLISAR